MTKCPVSGEECEWEKCPGLSAENLVKQMCDYLDGGSMDLGHKKEPVNKICSGSLFHDMMAEFKA
jgi:hypothetical protein